MITSELVAENGRTFVVKRADPAADADAARLAREATVLAIARHPGVVEVAPGPDPPDPARAPVELRTVHAGARTLAAPDIDPLAALQALATTAETVADLHALGLVHGRLDPDHIVLTSSGRAVLCGFAEAGLAGDRRPDGTVLVPSVDVAALGARLAEALDRLREPTSGPRRAAVDRAGLARLVERAAAADAGLGPSARAVAAGLAAALPRPARPIVVTPAGHIEDGVARSARPGPAPMRSDDDPGRGRVPARVPRARPHRRRRHRRLLAAAGVVAALASLGLGVSALADARDRSPARHPDPSAPGDPSDTSDTSGPTTQPPLAGPALQPGGELTIDGRRLSLGTAADQVVHGSWGCSGPDVVLLVRPDGSVFRFDALAEAGQDVTGELVGRLPPGAPVELVDDGAGCATLQALAHDGPVILAGPPAPPPTTPT